MLAALDELYQLRAELAALRSAPTADTEREATKGRVVTIELRPGVDDPSLLALAESDHLLTGFVELFEDATTYRVSAKDGYSVLISRLEAERVSFLDRFSMEERALILAGLRADAKTEEGA